MTEVPPFFIVGCGRSGTTLLRVALNRHSHLAIPQEGLFALDYLMADPSVPVSTMRELIVGEYELGEWGLNVTAEDLRDCADAVKLVIRLHELYAAQEGKEAWGDKTPRFVLYWKLLKRVFPDARFLHVVRDPRAVAHSLVNSDVHRSTYYHGAKRWERDVSAGLEMERALRSDALRVPYEDLVAEPDQVFHKICHFLGVPFESVGDAFDRGSAYDPYYQNIHRLVSKPITSARRDAWRSEMSCEQVRVVESIASRSMTDLGYQPTNEDPRLQISDVVKGQLDKVIRVPGRAKHFATLRKGYLSGLFGRKRALGTFTWRDIMRLFV